MYGSSTLSTRSWICKRTPPAMKSEGMEGHVISKAAYVGRYNVP
jgi:hypothetical protein